MQEDPFVTIALKAANEVLGHPLKMVRGKNLLYQIMVDNQLSITVDPARPKRGQSAFQTDLCVVEILNDEIEIPRVVLEFKKGLSTHDVLTYSAKANKHKRIYPYLRYGIVIGNESKVPGKFFTHNEALDFCIAAATYKEAQLKEALRNLLKSEVEASRKIEKIIYGNSEIRAYRVDVHTEENPGPVV